MMVPKCRAASRTFDADLVLIAAGFLGSREICCKCVRCRTECENQCRNRRQAHMQTNVKNVFTAGDMHRGQSLVVWAIREGREAAREVDESLMGYSYLSVQ